MINFFLISNLKIYWRNTTPYIGNVLKRKKHQENKVQCSSNPEREIQEKEGKTKHHSSWSHKDFKYWVDTYFNGYICLTHEDNSSQFSTAWCLEPSWSRILFQTIFFFWTDLWGYCGFLDWFCEAIEPLMLRLRDMFEMGRWQNCQCILVSLFSSHFSHQFEMIGFGGSGKKHLDLSIFPLIFLLWNKPYFPNFPSSFSFQPNTI